MDVCICDSVHVCEYTEYRHAIVILMFVCVRACRGECCTDEALKAETLQC